MSYKDMTIECAFTNTSYLISSHKITSIHPKTFTAPRAKSKTMKMFSVLKKIDLIYWHFKPGVQDLFVTSM